MSEPDSANVDENEPAPSARTALSSRWEPPQMRGPVIGLRGRKTGPRDLTQEQHSAWQAGFDAGQTRGLQSGLQAANAQIAQREHDLALRLELVEQMLQAMSAPLQALDEETERELCELALIVGKQLARREITLEPTQVISIVRDTVALLPASARHVRVHVHPLDAVILRERLAKPGQEAAWSIVEDPVMSRGGCRVNTDHAHIDARLESRAAVLLAACRDHVSAANCADPAAI